MPTHKANLKGHKSGKLKVLEFVGMRKGGAYWRCECRACGRKDYEQRAARLLDGTITSCGCQGYRRDSKRHKKARSKVPAAMREAIARMGGNALAALNAPEEA